MLLVSSGPDDSAKTAAAPNLFSLWNPRLIPLWIFWIFVRFLPESTCCRLNRKPDLGRIVGGGWLVNDFLDDERAMKHEKMIRKKGSNKEEEEVMVCVCVSGMM